ncbi:MAG: S-methyl-5-thioribose-1-phosphate isomerase [Candidatus Norongarragalinales archaeon]
MVFTANTKRAQRDIKALKIQGAEAVASAAVDALASEMQLFRGSPREFQKHLLETIDFLKSARPTEPALRNALRFIALQVVKSKARDVGELKLLVSQEARDYHARSLQTKLKIAEYGARLVPRRGNVLTHCHSSTVMRVLKRAHDAGKRPTVTCLETRPLFQGRKSAAELSAYGIKTRLVVDSAMVSILREMKDGDCVFVGADAITSEGDLINKIGTAPLALAANELDKKFYSATGTHKFDPLTMWGAAEPIEQRSPDEVLAPCEAVKFKIKKHGVKRVEVLNPAFDVVDSRYVTAYVTELGVIPPQSLLATVWKEFGLNEKSEY